MEAEFGTRFKKRLQGKPPEMRASVLKTVGRVLRDRDDPKLHVREMVGHAGVWEARIDYANRVTFEYPREGVIRFRNHCNHDVLNRP